MASILSNQRRSSRVSLLVVVLIRANMPDGRLVQVQAFVSVVNAHGGLLESPMELAAKQQIVLINPHSRKEARCRVVRVEKVAGLYEVAFEFNQRCALFWPISLPPADWSEQEDITSGNR
jgi:hypothetical protein